MEEKNYIYYVLAIDFEKKNEDILKENYESFVKRYKCEGYTYEDYLNKLELEGNKDFSISSFISSYHLNKDRAIEYATNNIGDINEAGSYNYVAVVSAPIDISYYNSNQNKDKDFELFKYDKENDVYVPLDKNSWEYLPIIYHCWGMYFSSSLFKK